MLNVNVERSLRLIAVGSSTGDMDIGLLASIDSKLGAVRLTIGYGLVIGETDYLTITKGDQY